MGFRAVRIAAFKLSGTSWPSARRDNISHVEFSVSKSVLFEVPGPPNASPITASLPWALCRSLRHRWTLFSKVHASSLACPTGSPLLTCARARSSSALIAQCRTAPLLLGVWRLRPSSCPQRSPDVAASSLTAPPLQRATSLSARGVSHLHGRRTCRRATTNSRLTYTATQACG